MLFGLRPCSRRAKRRRRQFGVFPNRALICILCTVVILGLLFLAPQWLLIIIIIILIALLAIVIKCA